MCPSGKRQSAAPWKDDDDEGGSAGEQRPPNLGIGGRIREIRGLCGINQRDLASLARVDPSYLSKVERGRAKPSLEIIAALLRLPQPVNLRYVLFGRGEPTLEGLPFSLRDWRDLEALLIRAAEEEAKLLAGFDQAHISSETYRLWLARNIFAQMERMAGHMADRSISMTWSPDEKAKALEKLETLLDAAEAPPQKPRTRRLKAP